MDSKGSQVGEDTHAAICRGELRGHEAALQEIGDSDWGLAIAGARHLVDAEGGSAPTVDALKSAKPSVAIQQACRHAERAALITWDLDRLRALAAVHEKLDDAAGLRRARAWIRLLEGDLDGLVEEGKALHAAGASAQDASLVIDATLLRAMAALTERDRDEAKSLARRASRMARTEGLRAERFLASIVLARVRRHGGRPHLATRILSAIAPIAPPVWQGWLRWERVIAGWRPKAMKMDPLQSAPNVPSKRAARALIDWAEAASSGDRDGFNTARDAVAAQVGGFADVAKEQLALAAALDPAVPVEDLPDSVRGWATGEEDETPAGLHGIVGPPDGPADSTIASVVCRPGRPPRRVLRVATPLLQLEGDIVRLARTRLRRGRVDTAIAALALAGEDGLPDAQLFEKAYEFEFVSGLHAGILDVLVHRMRSRVGDAATIHRKSGTMKLIPEGILVLPDPRCVEHVEDRLLRVIARHGGITTRQAAKELDVSVRTAQLALRRLLASGDCVLNRDGRRVQYLVEDTTFTEPTRY